MATSKRPPTFVGTLYKPPFELYGSFPTSARCLECMYCFSIVQKNGTGCYACAQWIDHRLPASSLNPDWPACAKFEKLEV